MMEEVLKSNSLQTMTYLSQVLPKTAHLKHTKTVRVIHLKQQITLPAVTGFTNNYQRFI